MEETYFRRGFGLKSRVQPLIDLEYHSALVESIRSEGDRKVMGNVTVRLAKEFGFCYGVDRAIDYAYETRHKFPEKRVRLIGEIIHNPHVNQRIRDMGMDFIQPEDDGTFDFSGLTEEDVVILPAFGVTVQHLGRAQRNRVRTGGYDVRVGSPGLEARGELRTGRIHLRHTRKALPRGIEGDGFPGQQP